MIVGATRTPVGKFRGSLAAVRADHLGAYVMAELLRRSAVASAAVDAYAVESHRRAAAAAAAAGWFQAEITPVPVTALRDQTLLGEVADFGADEAIRPGTGLDKLATLKTPFRTDGRVTAGNATQISDSVAALLLMSAAAADRLQVKPRARVRASTTVESDPTLMLTGPRSRPPAACWRWPG